MTGKRALIIGASRGLGFGLTAELLRRGWNVVATARDPAKADALQKLATDSGGKLQIERIDVDRQTDLAALKQRLTGKLDLLFVNAGISGPTNETAVTATREGVAQIMWTNALAPIRIAEQLLPQVVDGGTVAFMSSILGSIGENTSGGYDLYRISKASLNMLARGFAAGSAKDRKITVLNLHPGWVRTDMGGPSAPVSVEDSVRGLANVLETRHGAKHLYLDYQGREIPW
jgi:NAD(P)-dependent dehydrogenase (short-subunit alcohol dehydrogenase family)